MAPASASLLAALALAALPAAALRTCDAVADCGAVADNATDSSPALSACAAPSSGCSTILFPAGAQFLAGSVDLSHSRNLTLRFLDGAGLWGSGDQRLYPVQLALPYQGPNVTQFRALVYGRNVSGLTIVGPTSARIDGCGWPWWRNASTLTIQRPKLVEIVDAEDLVFEGMTYANSAFWTHHPTFATRVRYSGVTVLAPRAVGNTDGIDPDSSTDVLIEDCLIDVGDDGISIKSGYHDETLALMPAANILIRNTTVLSRNIAIGSACFGGIYNVSMVGGRIGDDEGSSPWAYKIKTHVPYGGVVSGITLSGVRLGKIAPNSWQQPHGGTAFDILLEQYGGGIDLSGRGLPQPPRTEIRDIVFDNIAITSAVSAGSIVVEPGFAVEGLVFGGVDFGNARLVRPWSCSGNVSGTSTADNSPAIPKACLG
jgi:hypothetical protein